MSRRSGNQWSGWDQRNRIPVNLSQSPSLRSSRHGNSTPQPESGTADWQLNNNRVPFSLFRQSSDARSTTAMRQFEQSPVERRNTSSNMSFPSELHPSMQIVLFDSMTRETRPRTEPFPRELSFPGLQHKLEQEKALKMLKKVIYGSDPKNLTRRLSLFYNGVAGSSNATMRGNNKEVNEDSNRCAICLDDFAIGNEVLVTPCNHMFHEECILPWMKSHGQCPVCRFVISQQTKANATNAPPPLLPLYDDLFTIEDLPTSVRSRHANSSWDMFLSSF